MSNTTNGTPLATLDAESTRHRHYQDVTRLLKEYTAVMYEIAHRIATYLDTKQAERVASWHNIVAVRRYQATWEELGAIALFASQMIVHYQLEESEAAELRLRIADAECSIDMAQSVIDAFREEHGELGSFKPSSKDVGALTQQLRSALKNNTSH